jgi:hypothetical protein
MQKGIVGLALILCVHASALAQYTGFQRSLNDKPWGVVRVDNGNGPVDRGQLSERFEVRQGDCGSQPGWSDCAMDRERSEMSELKPYTQLNQPTWYAWSVWFDHSWPDISPVTTTIGQFHQRNQSVPAVLFIQRDGRYFLRLESAKNLYPDDHVRTLVPAHSLKGRWHRIVVFANWSTDSNGILQVWVNGVQRLDHRGPNTINTTPVYFKYGIYRSFVSRVPNRPPHIVYIDEVRKGPSRESVDYLVNPKLQPVN